MRLHAADITQHACLVLVSNHQTKTQVYDGVHMRYRLPISMRGQPGMCLHTTKMTQHACLLLRAD
jgi:hypothetical protein